MYLKSTTCHGIVFISVQCDPSLVGYVESDYVGHMDNRTSMIWCVFNLVGGPIWWKSSAQSIMAMSIIEVEYMEVAEVVKETL